MNERLDAPGIVIRAYTAERVRGPECHGHIHGRGVRQGEDERPCDRTRHVPASSGERRVGARPLHETLKHALSAHLVPSAEFATPGLGVLVIDDPECLKVKVKRWLSKEV